jgi:hypothetical protein
LHRMVSLADIADGAAGLSVDDSASPVRPLVVVDLDGDLSPTEAAVRALQECSVVVVGFSANPLPPASAQLLEAMTLTLAPAGPGRAWVPGGLAELDTIAATVAATPFAAVTMASVLPVTARVSIPDGLVVESLAYSMLLAGPEFGAWRERTPRGTVPQDDEPVLLRRHDDELSVILNRPERHNAFGRAVRDGLIEALELADVDRSIARVVISGAGRSFCSGGDLDEFGSTPNTSAAHLVRLQQSAGLAIQRIADRVVVRVHGACIGAGIEVPAFAGRIEAREGSWFMLPELAFGLIPGAGGTASVTHRIGPWRTAYMVLTGARVDLDTALAWGLVDARA